MTLLRLITILALFFISWIVTDPYASAAGNESQLLNIRASQHTDYLRIVLEGPEEIISRGSVDQIDSEILVSFPDNNIELRKKKLPVAYTVQNDTISISLINRGELNFFFLTDPSRLVIDITHDDHQNPNTVLFDEEPLDEQRPEVIFNTEELVKEERENNFNITEPLENESNIDDEIKVTELLENESNMDDEIKVTDITPKELSVQEIIDTKKENMLILINALKYLIPILIAFVMLYIVLRLLLKPKVRKPVSQTNNVDLSETSDEIEEQSQTECICNLNDNTAEIIETDSKESPLDSLKWVDARTLSRFLETEHPQTVAFIICLLETQQAAEILELLPEEMRSDVTIRIAETTQIPESAIEVIETVLTSQLNLTNAGERQSFEGTKAIAEILKHCDRKIEQNILENVESCNTELASSIKELILTFKDIEKIDDRGMDLLLKSINTEELSIALRTASDNIQDKFMSNMSEKAAKILKEKMELTGPVKLSEVEKAQQSIVGAIKKLDEEGRIIIAGRSKERIVL
jgi:flagellar motor switch protein FliG